MIIQFQKKQNKKPKNLTTTGTDKYTSRDRNLFDDEIKGIVLTSNLDKKIILSEILLSKNQGNKTKEIHD